MIDVREIAKVYRRDGADIAALASMSFSVREREVVAVVGPSGCGKTTLLNIIAGFETPTSGQIIIDKHVVQKPSPDRVLVFQSSALFPWLTVGDNLAFPNARNSSGHDERLDQLCAQFGLVDFLDSWPKELSGGMAKIAEFIRALRAQPRVLLADEAFGELDEWTREKLQAAFQTILTQCPTTCVFVTHSIEEAVFVADRVLVCSSRPGRIIAEIVVPLPRPRKAEDRMASGFLAIRSRIASHLREQS